MKTAEKVQPAAFSHRIDAAESSAVREILKVTEKPEIISFAGGLPAPEFFPREEMAAAFSEAILEEGRASLQYSTTEGHAPLRHWIAERMVKRGISCDPDQVLVTSGSQQGLDLVAKALIDSGDKIIVERPTYLAALQVFSLFEAQFISVASDDDGMDTDDLEKQLKRHPDTKLIYTIPNFQNPSGTTLAGDRRKRMIELAQQYGVRIAEDDPYGELRYRGNTLLPVKAFDSTGPDSLVTYLSSFSKTITPGLRVAWLITEPKLYSKLVMAKQASDLHASTVSQYAIQKYLAQGHYDTHVSRLCEVYGRRCQVMLDSLATHFPADVRWTRPEGGMFLWAELPREDDTAKMLQAAIAAKVAFVPGAPFFAGDRPGNFMRLNFSNQTPERIEQGIKTLAEVISSFRNASGRQAA